MLSWSLVIGLSGLKKTRVVALVGLEVQSADYISPSTCVGCDMVIGAEDMDVRFCG